MYKGLWYYWGHGRSVLEEEVERGVAHIVEHLAFSATQKYTNHDIVRFLESIGAEFGACQNAVTSADDTVYELFVPVDKLELLSEAISVLAEFSSEVSTIFTLFCNPQQFLLKLNYQHCADSCLKRWFRKRKRCCYGRVQRESECYWKDAGCALAFDDGRFKGTATKKLIIFNYFDQEIFHSIMSFHL